MPFIILLFLQQNVVAQAKDDFSYINVEITSDKQVYEDGEINYSILISNNSGSKVKDVVVKSTLPKTLEVTNKDILIENGKAVWKLDTIAPFSQVSLDFSAKVKTVANQTPSEPGTGVQKTTEPVVNVEVGNGDDDKDLNKAPKTGDDTTFLPYIIILTISIGILVVSFVGIKKSRNQKPITFIIILVLFLPSFTVAKAEERKETVNKTHKVTVKDIEYTLNVEVESTIEEDSTLLLRAKRGFGIPQLQWDALEDVTYQVKRGQTPFTLEILSAGLLENSFVDNESKPENSYYYQVVAMKGDIELYQSTIILVNAFIDGDSDGITDEEEISYKTDKENADSDGDELLDGEEVFFENTDPLKKDTDVDGLFDVFEVTYFTEDVLEPTKKDSDENSIDDGLEDFDLDGLSNLKEQEYKTNPFSDDTDKDNLTDREEINLYHTDPLESDTDFDMLDDDSELKFGTDPKKTDTDGDGILDGKEKREQEVQSSDLNASVSFNATGDAEKTTTLQKDNFAKGLMGEDGMVGQPIDITTTSEFENATLTFSYDPYTLGDIQEENLTIFYFNPDTWQLELVENQTHNRDNHTVSANLPHFSTYILADRLRWEATIIDNPVSVPDTCSKPEEVQEKPIDLVFVIDSSGSMIDNDPNDFRITGAKQIIDTLKTSDQAAVVGDQGAVVDFDSYASLVQGLTEDKNLLKSAVDRIDSSGGTNIGAGVSVALNELQNKGRKTSNKVIILLTDGEGSYHSSYTTRAKDLGVKIFTIGLGTNIDEGLLKEIAKGTEGDYYHTVSAEKIPELFEKARDVSQEIDTDGDCIVDWIEKLSDREGGYVVQNTLGNLFTDYSSDFTEQHSDSDGLSDLEELAPFTDPTILAALPNIITNPGKTKVHLKEWPRSNPNNTDTDKDEDNDKVDDKPTVAFKNPVMLVHGIRSNTGDTWGADAWLDNGQPLCFKLCEQDVPDFTEDVPTYKTVTGTEYKRGDETNYVDLDAQYIKNINEGDEYLAPYLIDQGYKVNKDMFVFNWEHIDHIKLASEHMESYLDMLVKDYIKVKNFKDVDIISESKNSGEIQFDLVTHSAGGLVSRYYIENLMSSENVQIDKLITVDTPHWGSNDKNNGGAYGVFIDLDRNDSPLLYKDSKNRTPRGEPGTVALNSNYESNTKYYFIGGLIGRYDSLGFNKYYYPEDIDPTMLTLDTALKSKTDLDLYSEIKVKLAGKGIEMPKVDVEHTDFFGDNIVELGSQMGIPAQFQRSKESELNSILYDGAYVLVGRNEHSEHGKILEQPQVHKKIAELLKN